MAEEEVDSSEKILLTTFKRNILNHFGFYNINGTNKIFAFLYVKFAFFS